MKRLLRYNVASIILFIILVSCCPVVNAAPRGQFLGIDTWEGNTITFKIRFYVDSSGTYPDMGSYNVYGFALHLEATDSNSGVKILDVTNNYSGNSILFVHPGRDAVVPIKATFSQLKGHNEANFKGTVTNVNYERAR